MKIRRHVAAWVAALLVPLALLAAGCGGGGGSDEPNHFERIEDTRTVEKGGEWTPPAVEGYAKIALVRIFKAERGLPRNVKGYILYTHTASEPVREIFQQDQAGLWYVVLRTTTEPPVELSRLPVPISVPGPDGTGSYTLTGSELVSEIPPAAHYEQ